MKNKIKSIRENVKELREQSKIKHNDITIYQSFGEVLIELEILEELLEDIESDN